MITVAEFRQWAEWHGFHPGVSNRYELSLYFGRSLTMIYIICFLDNYSVLDSDIAAVFIIITDNNDEVYLQVNSSDIV